MQLIYVFLRHFRRNKVNTGNHGSLSNIQTPTYSEIRSTDQVRDCFNNTFSENLNNCL